jgi:predicted cupin superfamily sugar epimerase
MVDRAAQLVRALHLGPHPEGGHYREVHRSSTRVTRAGVERAALTTILFLLKEGEHSRWHVVDSDEAWHYHEGEPLELVTYDPESARIDTVHLGVSGPDRSAVHVVPAGTWQAARPLGAYALVGCTVGPGFEFEDFRFVGDVPGHERVLDGALSAYRELL